MTSISGVEFEDAWQARLIVDLDGLQVPVIGRQHLIANKNASGRERDRLDVELLERQKEE